MTTGGAGVGLDYCLLIIGYYLYLVSWYLELGGVGFGGGVHVVVK
jgi:hypothetical protein